MKAIITILLTLTIFASHANESSSSIEKPKQRKEFRFKKMSGKLVLEMSNIKVVGYSGQEVIISKQVEEKEVDDRAAGLKPINSAGLDDNTGLGLSLVEEGDVTSIIRTVHVDTDDSVFVQVPKNIAVTILGAKTAWMAGSIEVSDLSNELEISNTMGDIILQNVTGPMTVKTVHGNVEGVLSNPVKGPISIINTLGFVDIALPTTTRANLQLGTTMGELYAAEDFKIERTQIKNTGRNRSASESTKTITVRNGRNVKIDSAVFSTDDIEQIAEDATRGLTLSKGRGIVISGNGSKVVGTINGGGEDIILRTTHGNIYLRKP